MPAQVTLPALKAFAYRGCDYRRGDLVAMSPIDAAIHARRGHVSLTRTYRTRHLVAEQTVDVPAAKRRRRPRLRRIKKILE